MADGAAKNVEAIHRLTPVQEGILFHAEGGAGAARGTYLLQFTCVLAGSLDEERFEDAWRTVIARHGALRTLYTWKGRPHPLAVVRREAPFSIQWVRDRADIAGAEGTDSLPVPTSPATGVGEPLERWMEADRREGLDLERAPLMRVRVATAAGDRARLSWTFHHICLDGWSMRIVLDEVLRVYGGEDLDGTALAPGQAAFSEWLGTLDQESGRAHWRERFHGWDGPVPLDINAARGDDVAGVVEESSADLGPERTAQVLELAARAQVTPAVVLRAAWALAVSRLTNTSDVVFGTTVAGRPPEIERIEQAVGMFIGTIPVRSVVPWERSVEGWLAELHREQLADAAHEHVPLATIQRDVLTHAGEELFDTILVVENHAAGTAARGELRVEGPRFLERSHYRLALLVLPGDTWELTVIGDRESAASVLGLVGGLLDGLCTGGTVALAVDHAIDKDPRVQVFEGRAIPDSSGSSLRLGGHRATSPAIISGDEAVSFGEFDARAASIARRFRAAGLSHQDRVGLAMERGPEAILAMVGALRAGVVYAPVDPDAPDERVSALVRSAGLNRVIRELDELPPDSGDHGVDACAPGELAYVLFTSGSTGEPKGVEITVDGLACSTLARPAVYGGDVGAFLLLSPLHFDSSVAGIYWTIHTGGALVLPAPGEERDPAAILGLIERHGVTHTLMLPSLWDALLDSGSPVLGRLDTVIVAGEACTDALVERHFHAVPGVRLFNEYGPTEATVWATAAEAQPGRPIGIGGPVPAMTAAVLDHRGRLAEPGTIGELVLAGRGLARGYALDDVRTAAAFRAVHLPGHGTRRVYHTGDLVRVPRAGEQLEFHGRGDHQVKIRGQRIELGEIEAVAAAAPGVAEAVASVLGVDGARGPAGRKQLVLHVAARGGVALEESQVRAWLAERLSGAMLPARIIAMAELPRTATGKVDRGALPELSAPEPSAEARAVRQVEAVCGPDAEALRSAWMELLGLESLSTSDDFFALGGDSLTSIRLLARAHRMGIQVTPAQFMERPTVDGMLAVGRASGGAGPGASEPDLEPGESVLLPAQRWFLEGLGTAPGWWSMTQQLDLDQGALSEQDLARALNALVLRHPALRPEIDRSADGWGPAVGVRRTWSVEVARVPGGGAAELSELHRGLGVHGGCLVAAALLSPDVDGARGPRVLITASHLAVDAVSMTILQDELRAILAREPLGEVPAPAGLCGAALERYARSDAAAAELPHWTGIEDAGVKPLELGPPGTVADEAAAVRELDGTRSGRLLDQAHGAYGTKVLDLITLAVARAVGEGRERVLLEMETHGREPHLAAFDMSRTVGWFTALWPHVVQCGGDDLGALIRRVKDDLRAVPGNGAGFGPLRWSHPVEATVERLASLPRREVLLNHMGTTGGTPIPDEAAGGTLRSAELPRRHAMEVVTWLNRETGVLSVRTALSRRVHGDARAAQLAQAIVFELEAIIDHCTAADGPGATPSDFPLAGLDQAALNKLGDLLGD